MFLQNSIKQSVIFVQPTIPRYREGFFEGLYEKLGDRLIVYASDMQIGVISQNKDDFVWKKLLGKENTILPGLSWQTGALDINIRQGDLVVLSGAPRCISNMALLVKARRVGAKVVWWGHYWSSTSKPWRAKLRLRLLQQGDCALFYTDQEIEEFCKQFPDRHQFPIFALNNGIDNQMIRKIRAPYISREREKRLLFIGRLSVKSRLVLLLRALAFDECKDVILDVIGDGDALSVLQHQAEELGIERRVYWHGGLVNEEKISEIANRCRVFVYPGAVGLSLIHAMAYGLPVIIHNNRWGHMPEIAAFIEGVNGISFRPENIGSLAGAIANIIDDHNRLDTMSGEAIRLTNKTFNTENMVERFMLALATLGYG